MLRRRVDSPLAGLQRPKAGVLGELLYIQSWPMDRECLKMQTPLTQSCWSYHCSLARLVGWLILRHSDV